MPTPFSGTDAAKFIDERINQLSHRKTQAEIAAEAGFSNANMITYLKTGKSRLPFDRVPALAKALEVDPAWMMRLSIEQAVGVTAAKAILESFETPVSANEQQWLDEIRQASQNRDPRPTTRTRAALRAIFEK